MRNVLIIAAGAFSLTVLPAALAAQDAASPNSGQPSTTSQTTGQTTSQTSSQTTRQANVEATPAPRTTTVTNAGGRTVITTNNPGNLTPPPADAQNRTYPVCSRTVQDNCQNPGEGGAARR